MRTAELQWVWLLLSRYLDRWSSGEIVSWPLDRTPPSRLTVWPHFDPGRSYMYSAYMCNPPLVHEGWLPCVWQQKSFSQSPKSPFSLYSPLVHPLLYRFIMGRHNTSSSSGYKLVTRDCTTVWVQRSIILLFGHLLSLFKFRYTNRTRRP